jgi:hypothetical protein
MGPPNPTANPHVGPKPSVSFHFPPVDTTASLTKLLHAIQCCFVQPMALYIQQHGYNQKAAKIQLLAAQHRLEDSADVAATILVGEKDPAPRTLTASIISTVRKETNMTEKRLQSIEDRLGYEQSKRIRMESRLPRVSASAKNAQGATAGGAAPKKSTGQGRPRHLPRQPSTNGRGRTNPPRRQGTQRKGHTHPPRQSNLNQRRTQPPSFTPPNPPPQPPTHAQTREQPPTPHPTSTHYDRDASGQSSTAGTEPVLYNDGWGRTPAPPPSNAQPRSKRTW